MTRGSIIGIFISAAATQLPHAVSSVEAYAGSGLKGDRYFAQKGTFSDVVCEGDGRDLTLIAQESLHDLAREYGMTLSPAESRRNLLTQDIDLNELVGKTFSVGEVWIEGIRLCQPCAHLETVTGQKLLKSLNNRGGLRANILNDGTIRVGDAISV
jgi:MOSC domain-containing protein YiiM